MGATEQTLTAKEKAGSGGLPDRSGTLACPSRIESTVESSARHTTFPSGCDPQPDTASQRGQTRRRHRSVQSPARNRHTGETKPRVHRRPKPRPSRGGNACLLAPKSTLVQSLRCCKKCGGWEEKSNRRSHANERSGDGRRTTRQRRQQRRRRPRRGRRRGRAGRKGEGGGSATRRTVRSQEAWATTIQMGPASSKSPERKGG